MVKDKCVHKSGNQPGRVSRVWWRGRDSWMDRWTIWYLDGVTAYLDSYRYLYWECRALAQWYCYNQGDDDITLYRVIRLSQYRICTINTCLYYHDLQLQSMYAICMIETTLGDWPPPRISKTGHHQLRSVPSGNTALHHAASGQPAASTYIFMTELFFLGQNMVWM